MNNPEPCSRRLQCPQGLNYIHATIGFVELAEVTHRLPKSLMRMPGPQGNSQAQNLFAIVSYLLDQEGVQFELRAATVS